MSRTSNTRSLQALAEEYRGALPSEFFNELDRIHAELAEGRFPSPLTTRGAKSGLLPRVIDAVLQELHTLLCTGDPTYADERRAGHRITKDTVHFVAGLVVGKLGATDHELVVGVAAYLALLIARMGIRVFCRLSGPRKDAKKPRSANRRR